jgi:hypothetical protein
LNRESQVLQPWECQQAIPPYFLRNLFEAARNGPATRRLHYLCSQLNLKGTPIEGWKLTITSATCGVHR